MTAPSDNVFISSSGLPNKITQPEPSPLTRAATAQDRVAKTLEELRLQISAVQAEIAERQPHGLRRDSQPLAVSKLVPLLTQMNAATKELEQTLTDAHETIENLRAERGQLQSLCVIAEHLNSTLERTDLLERILTDLLLLLRANRGAILLKEKDVERLRFEAAMRADGARIGYEDTAWVQAIASQVWVSQQPMLLKPPDIAEQIKQSGSAPSEQILSLLCAPLKLKNTSIGLVFVDRLAPFEPFTVKHIDLLAAFCNEAAIAIQNADLFVLQRQSMLEISAMRTYTESILSSISSGVMALDNEGRVTRFNHAMELILGVSAASALDQQYVRAISAIDAPEFHTKLTTTLGSLTPQEEFLKDAPIRGIGKKTLHAGWAALKDTEQRRLGSVIVIDDLTALESAQYEAQVFRKYVQQDIVDFVVRDPEKSELGGATKIITVLFADIRGFTGISETMEPAALVALLNEYLSIATHAIIAEGGAVTMFQGDAVMALYNAPQEQADHAMRAVRSALRMRTDIEEFSHKTGQRPMKVGIGINTGPALVGNIGAKGILQNFTAIGDVVNSAKRLEENAATNQILLSGASYSLVESQAQVRKLDDLMAKGKSNPMSVWELLSVMER